MNPILDILHLFFVYSTMRRPNMITLQRKIAMAQEQAIRKYRDFLVKGLGDQALGSSEELTTKANAAVKAVKTRLRTKFDRMLAVADPGNGESFILEIQIPSHRCLLFHTGRHEF